MHNKYAIIQKDLAGVVPIYTSEFKQNCLIVLKHTHGNININTATADPIEKKCNTRTTIGEGSGEMRIP